MSTTDQGDFEVLSGEALAEYRAWKAAGATNEPTRPANSQDWAGMDASTAFLLIQRHADGWADIELMMNEWRTANPPTANSVPDEWVQVTQHLLNSQEPWLYKPCWLAFQSGAVLRGVYEWRQGRNPDRFISDEVGDVWAFDVSHVMPVSTPPHPSKARLSASPAPAQQDRTVIGYVPMSAVEETPLDGYVPVYAIKEQP